jgi:quercetin dioxygenase-like cupin family protein
MHLHRLALAAIVAVAVAIPVSGSAQDAPPPEVNVVLENDDVRMVRVAYQPGNASPEHTHPVPRTIFVESGGELELTYPDGTTERMTLVTGTANWRMAETHAVLNVGDTQVILVETEVRSSGTP